MPLTPPSLAPLPTVEQVTMAVLGGEVYFSFSANENYSNSNASNIGTCVEPMVNSDICKFRVILDVYVVTLLCLFGIVGNVLSIIILERDRTVRNTTRYLLQMLGVSDSLYLVACLLFQTVGTLEECTSWHAALNFYWTHLKTAVYACASIAQTCTVWIVVIVTADRWVAITRPLQAPRYSTLSRVRKEVVIAWFIATVYNVPRFFERSIVSYDDNEGKILCWRVKWTWLREHPYYVIIYDSALFFLLRFLLPLSSLAFFNTKLIQAIRTSNSMNRSVSSSSSRKRKRTYYRNGSFTLAENSDSGSGPAIQSCYSCRRRESNFSYQKMRNTQMLIVVVIVFFICELPDFLLRMYLSVYSVLRMLDDSYKDMYLKYQKPVLLYVNVTSNFMLTVNSCSNFIIYILIGRKFRAILVDMILGRRRKSSMAEMALQL